MNQTRRFSSSTYFIAPRSILDTVVTVFLFHSFFSLTLGMRHIDRHAIAFCQDSRNISTQVIVAVY
ncbi:hypothetical protein K450DRAFT_228601 [Umbelopsis ramanniana AG]|uniref:Uncharacterized protein n=1 Tax=Umbelopsis ramanniana AG TaxID=1314678 RepID=A0AAD5HFF1_UMBRA|nr:uncharacterized protein K450DRAFT_228601 [Umbelopsis ramanniana AG]KAI8582362.1 hypothetical protein K450DRAFT_228601 [Umbelopsis ramanniana AG]